VRPIYLDYNATTPLLPEVVNAMQPYLTEYFGNPSSSHSYGLQTRQAIETARQQVANLLGCDREEIIFTSGGSESNNLAIKGAAFAHRRKGNHLITSLIEHPAVMEVCQFLETHGFEVTYIPVDSFGQVDPADVQKAIKSGTILITIMHANNEVGTIQSIADITAMARRHDILVHTDAAQSVGKIPTRIDDLGVDLLSLAGHKLYAPKGVGVLYIRRGVEVEKLIHGAGHEHNRRAGTENVLEIVGLGKACEIAGKDLPATMDHLKRMRDQLYNGLRAELEDLVSFRLNGHPQHRLPNTLNISFANIEANLLLAEIGDNVAVSAGAACHSDRIDISPTLQAMQVPLPYAMGTIRFSTGRPTTSPEIEETVRIVSSTVKKLSAAGDKTAPLSVMAQVKLTHFTQGLGCACKLRPQVLEKILKQLPLPLDNRVLVGTETSDDAAVFKIDDQTAVVQTVDFFTPIVDDPFDFGRIAASNALSDIYAMGAQPLFALNLVGFPSQRLPMDVLEKILQGAQQIAVEAGIAILGGHTIEDNEPKYGLVVCGIVNPGQIWRNHGAKPGDALILTKPLGTGILTTALKNGLLSAEKCTEVTSLMTQLNKTASEILKKHTVHACTDVTGFGLLGHLHEMSMASHIDIHLAARKVPIIPGVEDFVNLGMVPGGTKNNLDYVSDWVEWGSSISDSLKYILVDAQTSGGLLTAIPAKEATQIIKEMHHSGLAAARQIGEFQKSGTGIIKVI
jgi:cysteine desulfurase